MRTIASNYEYSLLVDDSATGGEWVITKSGQEVRRGTDDEIVGIFCDIAMGKIAVIDRSVIDRGKF